MTTLRIVSLNAWGGQLWDALSSWIPSIGADVLCLQEVIRAPQPSPDWLHYEDPNRRLEQRADLFGDVSFLLPDHQARFAPAARGTLKDKSGTSWLSEHGLGTWVRRDFGITKAYQGFVHGTYRPDGWGEEPVPRAIQIHRVTDAETGRSLNVAHFHGLRDPGGKSDTPTRAAQTKAVVEAISEQFPMEEPAILAGDFNLLPDSAFFGALADLGFVDLVTTRGHKDTRTSLYKKPQRFADYFLVNSRVQVRDFDVPAHPEISDHSALIADISL